MELGLSNTLLAGDPRLIDHIVGEVKSQGIFDQFRKECIADVDTKPAYQNLRTRVEGSVNSFLSKQTWKPDLNKNQLRETLRKHIHEAPYLDAGVERIVDQVVNPKVYSVFMPQIEDVVYKFLGIERPKTKEKTGACGLKDLLPKDLDPVSPESDKNSLKDVSLESMDAIDDAEADTIKNEKIEEKPEEMNNEKVKDNISENGQISGDEKVDESCKNLHKTGGSSNLMNISTKSDDKTEEEEEDSPTFEPIDIMNLNESNISNDSHLSGISELTSHRSRSPDFSNELSRDNFDYSNQDSQLSKVSSDSRLSIVTDFGSSNHASTPIHDAIRDTKDKSDKSVTDNFRAIREFESSKNKSKNNFESKDAKDTKSVKSLSSKENSRDATDSGIKDKYDHKNRERSKDESKSKSSKDKIHSKDSKYYKDRGNDKKKQSSHSSTKYDKYGKVKPKEKSEQMRESVEKSKDLMENFKDMSNKLKDEKIRESDKKDSSKEAKDLKDLYKEKIRELREKKELTEKEKLNKDNKEIKPSKDTKDRKDSPKDKKPPKKDHKNSSSKNHEGKSIKSDKVTDGKDKKGEIKDKNKRDEKHPSKDGKNKNHVMTKSDSIDKSFEKQDIKKIKSEKDRSDKSEIKKEKASSDKLNGRKEPRNNSQSRSSDRSDSKKDVKHDISSKDKKRRDDKKSRPKDDHSSLRKNSNDRRSTDRDGSNGSNSKSSQSSSSSSNTTSSKTSTSSLVKETSHVSNSSSETSDSIEETRISELKLPSQQFYNKYANKPDGEFNVQSYSKVEMYDENDHDEYAEPESSENILPLKKRPLFNEEDTFAIGEVKIKKPKFAKNFHEAKKLMKIRKQMEKQKLREIKKVEKKVQQKPEQPVQTNAANDNDNLDSVPDEERVQIIEIPDEEYEEPYPEEQTNLALEEGSIILLEGQPYANNLQQTLCNMELCIKQSLDQTIFNKKSEPTTQYSEIDEKIKFQEQSITPVCDEENLENSEKKCVLDNKEVENSVEVSENTKNHTVIECKLEDTVLETFESSSKMICNDEVSKRIKNEESITCKNNEKSAGEENILIKDCTAIQSTSLVKDDLEDCRYFKVDNEKSEKFSNFLESLELVESTTLEDIIESMGGQVVSSMPKSMAPPLPKRKLSSSPLTDILLNNSNNNNDGHKNTITVPNEEALNNIKKRKLIGAKKQRFPANPCAPQSLLNGENFVMPLSPESDVSATSEKTPSSNVMKEEKSRHRSSQRYSSDDLYKPRPLFSSSSRRSRRSNQA